MGKRPWALARNQINQFRCSYMDLATSSFNELRAYAIGLGITEAEAKKYGNVRHKRTWSLAIEHYQVTHNLPLINQPNWPSKTPTPSAPIPPSFTSAKSGQALPLNFAEVVQKHYDYLSNLPKIKADRTVWNCPQCHPILSPHCDLCHGQGQIDIYRAIAWTLAYMEFLGCTVKEIEHLRNQSIDLETLITNLQICQAIKSANDILARTAKWVR